jgi:predicted transcriptional regulator
MLKQFSEINKYYAINGTDTEGKLITSICKVLEANAVGTATSIWGDIPYSEAVNPAISDPVFDKQSAIYNALQTKLDEAIVVLSDPTTKIPFQKISFLEEIKTNGRKQLTR